MQAASHTIAAQASMHHAYLLGLQLMIASNKEAAVVGDWMFRLFRRQHQGKILIEGMGDETELQVLEENRSIRIVHSKLRIARGLEPAQRELVLACWQQLWIGALRSYRSMKQLDVVVGEDSIDWTLSEVAATSVP